MQGRAGHSRPMISSAPCAGAACAAVLMATTLLVGAAPARGASLPAEAGCRDTMAKAARKATSLAVSTRAKCIKQRMRKKLGETVDCLADPASLGGTGTGDARTDLKLGRFAKMRDQQANKLGRSCGSVDLSATGIGNACTPAVTTMAELAECVVIDLGKTAGDNLAAVVNVPQKTVTPPSGARRCFKIVGRALANVEQRDSEQRAECHRAAALGAGEFDCLATVAPPGIVNPTNYQRADDKLVKRYTRFQASISTFCTGIDFASIGFDLVQADRTGPPFALEDTIGAVYDALLTETTAINAGVFPPGPYCGDGNKDPGEECDDGNRESCDGCDRDCSLALCGNGAACSPELCDDGNNAGGDGCDANCVTELCGNGVVQPGEQCDDGLLNSDTTPDACRTDCSLPSCGDGVIDSGEACEPPGVGGCEPNCTSPNCGDGILDIGEECDDGAGNSDTTPDACRTSCRLPSCGDDVVDSGEQCDPPDGGIVCQSDCTFVACGNGEPDPGEQCDDGPANSDTTPDACRTNCTLPSCGDDVIDSGEACDDGGESALCDDDCTAAGCGDGNANAAAGEQCDDGGFVDGDGCDSNCTLTGCPNGIVTAGEFCDDGGDSPSCDDDCTAPECGDGNANGPAGEDCDTAGESATCDADCTAVECGDGVVNGAAGEQCEDGNSVGGDGCSATCTCEGGCQDPQCPGSGELVLYAGVRATACTSDSDCIVDGALVGHCDLVLGQCVTDTDLDTGWTGFAHNADINDVVITRARLACPGPFDGGSSEPCGECVVAGFDPSTDLCRCNNDNQAICHSPFDLDPTDCGTGVACTVDTDCRRCNGNVSKTCLKDDDCGPGEGVCMTGDRLPSCVSGQCIGTCDCYFGPPLPLSSGGVPACVLNRFAVDVSGTANVDLGAGVINANLKSKVFLPQPVTKPCPWCEGDLIPRDGVRDGTCMGGGDNEGTACDVHSENLTFPAPSGAGHSLDCFPAVGTNVSGAGLTINLVNTTGSLSLPSGVDCGFTVAPEKCPCSVCSSDTSVPCTSNADCVGSGVCTRLAQGRPRQNECTEPSFACDDTGNGIDGECRDGPTNQFCDGVVRASGEPYVPCSTNASCDSTDCGSGIGVGLCGTCSLARKRPCFLPTILASGSPDPQAPVGVALFCIPPTGNAGIDTVAGLPGPGRVTNAARARTFCASDPGVEYVPGTGGCP